jgi:hypothetical protein
VAEIAGTAPGFADPRPNSTDVETSDDPTGARTLGAPLVGTLIRAGLAAMAAITFASALLVAIAHVDDRYNVNHVSGTWLALAADLRDGTLYRPLFENGDFGGTWYTPLQFVLQAGAESLTGEWIVSGKLLAYALAAGLLALVYQLLRERGGPRSVSAALVAVILLSQAGLFASTSIRGDMLPLVLQLGAVALVARSHSTQSLGIAGLLCALAVTAKLAAVWAPLTIVLWLLFRERRRLVPYIASFVGSLVVLLGLLELWSGGRMSDTLLAVGGSGNSEASSPLAGIPRLFDFLVRTAGPVWLLLPFVLLALLLAAGERRLDIWQLAFLIELPLLALVLADPGSDFNHLVDLVVLAVLVVGGVWVRFVPRPGELNALGAVLALALLLGGADAYRQTLQSDTADAAKSLLGKSADAYPTDPLARYVARDDSVLSEDPAIPVLRDDTPVIIDAVSVRRVGIDHPEWLADLERRLERGTFDKVVLVHPVSDEAWYGTRNFGASIRQAIEDEYRLVAKVPNRPLDYWVYAPRS